MVNTAAITPHTELFRNFILLRDLPPKLQTELARNAQLLEIAPNSLLFRQGDSDPYVFYLISGQLQMLADGQLVLEVRARTETAAHPLSQLQPRRLSARAKTAVTVLRLPRALLDAALSQPGTVAPATASALEVAELSTPDQNQDWMTRLLRSALFAQIPAANIQRLFSQLERLEVLAGQVLIRQDSEGDYYYILRDGGAQVTRNQPGNCAVVLAELTAGDTFGEEALVADARRNASVIMLTNGTVMRLRKQDFIDIIRAPVLHEVDFAEAMRRIKQGDCWLDVRSTAECEQHPLAGAVTIPLANLRERGAALTASGGYVAVCDNGERSAVAAFMLTAAGIRAVSLRGGLCACGLLEPLNGGANIISLPAQKPGTAVADGNLSSARVEAESQLAALQAELATLNLKLAEAERRQVAAEAAREHLAARASHAVQVERERLQQQAGAAQRAQEVILQLRSELEVSRQQAQERAEKLRAEEAERLQLAKQMADARLAEEIKKLGQSYAWKEQELRQLLDQQQRAEQQLHTTRQQLAKEKWQHRQRLRDGRQLQLQQGQAHAQREAALRQTIASKLAQERAQLEAEFADSARRLAALEHERDAAEAARQAARQEAEQIIAEQQSEFERRYAQLQQQLEQTRAELETQTHTLQQNLELACEARAQAEFARHRAEQHLAKVVAEQSPAAAQESILETRVRAENLAAIRHNALAARGQMLAAEQAEHKARTALAENAVRLARQRENEQHLQQQLEADLAAWVQEQHEREASPAQRLHAVRQAECHQRILERARAAQQATCEHDDRLLAELHLVTSQRSRQPR